MKRVFYIIITILTANGCTDSSIKKTYYPSGKIEREYTVDENQKTDGIAKGYWENGNLKEVYSWNHGIANGTTKKYFESGKLSLIGHFTNGLQDSATTEYFENGQVHTVSYYKDGKADGKFISYFENGKTEMIADLRNDSTLCSIRFNDNATHSVSKLIIQPAYIDIPDTMHINGNEKIVETLMDSSFIQYFDASASLYKDETDIFNGKPPVFNCRIIKAVTEFDFFLPEGCKPGIYYVHLKLSPINADKSVITLNTQRKIIVVK